MNRRRIVLLAAALALAGLVSTARAATYTWDPNGDHATDGGGTWTAGAGTWYYNSADTTWTDGNIAAFGWSPGGTASYTVTLGFTSARPDLTFNNENYTHQP